MAAKKVLLIEPYYTGSHRQLIELLHQELLQQKFGAESLTLDVQLVTMTGKKWHWRARTSALHLAQNIQTDVNYTSVFASSVLPLHDLVALRPELTKSRKVIYFHENQLVYPVRNSKTRDFQYGYNQILSCLVADIILFNSRFNLESFLSNLNSFFKLQPDFRPKNLREQIEPKCRVLYFPLDLEAIPRPNELLKDLDSKPYRILWPHRWEFDKGPDEFFNAIFQLVSEGKLNFRLSILGESFTDNPPIFSEVKERLAPYIDHFGFLPSKAEYYQVLSQSDIVVSTAHHEFFGVAMLEAAYAGVFPLCPNKLVYPEIFHSKCLYNSELDLYKNLKKILACTRTEFNLFREQSKVDFTQFDWKILKKEYLSVILH